MQRFRYKQEKEQKARDLRMSARRFYDCTQDACITSVKRHYCMLKNQHVTQSIATIRHHEEQTSSPNTNRRQKNRSRQIGDVRTFAAPANKANSLLVQQTCYFSISTENQVKERAQTHDVFAIIRGGELTRHCCSCSLHLAVQQS